MHLHLLLVLPWGPFLSVRCRAVQRFFPLALLAAPLLLLPPAAAPAQPFPLDAGPLEEATTVKPSDASRDSEASLGAEDEAAETEETLVAAVVAAPALDAVPLLRTALEAVVVVVAAAAAGTGDTAGSEPMMPPALFCFSKARANRFL